MAKEASASSTLSQCVTCKTGYNPFNIGDSKKCYKVIGWRRLSEANNLCKNEGATLPLPQNSEENADFYDLLKKIKKFSSDKLVLGLNDEQNEGSFVSSNGQKQYFAKWDKHPYFNNNKDRNHVALGFNGLWRHLEGLIQHMILKRLNLLN